MSVREIINKYDEKCYELRNAIRETKQAEEEEIRKYLQENNLSELVVRKDNGHIGKLSVEVDEYFRVGFYPLTKTGSVSKKREYYFGSEVETLFVPYKAGDNND